MLYNNAHSKYNWIEFYYPFDKEIHWFRPNYFNKFYANIAQAMSFMLWLDYIIIDIGVKILLYGSNVNIRSLF